MFAQVSLLDEVEVPSRLELEAGGDLLLFLLSSRPIGSEFSTAVVASGSETWSNSLSL